MLCENTKNRRYKERGRHPVRNIEIVMSEVKVKREGRRRKNFMTLSTLRCPTFY